MQIVFNGQVQEVREPLTVADLLAQSKLSSKSVAVEVNRDVVPRAQHAARALAAGDQVEVVSLVGGG